MSGVFAYDPAIKLKNDFRATYKIYLLKNPFTEEIFYVGITKKELNERLAGHINERTGVNRAKNNYIKEITKNGKRPIIEHVETIEGISRIDGAFALDRERYWIQYHKAQGSNLLNIVHISMGRYSEYQLYLKDVAEGFYRPIYYFCGTTESGACVYDEKRIIQDGFTLKKTPEIEDHFHPSIFKSGDGFYELFMNGLREEFKTKDWPPDWISLDLLKKILPMPEWSPEFADDIPPDEFLLDLQLDDCDDEIDDWDESDDFAEIDDYI